MVATLMKTELFAMCRPTQILRVDLNPVDTFGAIGIVHTFVRSPEAKGIKEGTEKNDS